MNTSGKNPQPGGRRGELPPEFQFLKELSHAGEIPRDQVLHWAQNILRQIKQHADLLRQHGFDPEFMQSTLGPPLVQAETSQRELDAAQDAALHAAADVADSMRDLVDGLEDFMAEVRRDNPFHPGLEESEELLQQLREEYPKLPED